MRRVGRIEISILISLTSYRGCSTANKRTIAVYRSEMSQLKAAGADKLGNVSGTDKCAVENNNKVNDT